MPNDRSRSFWDSVAPAYDRRSAWLERRLLARGRGWVCRRARGHTLDLGVGTGANLRHLPDDVVVTGVDHSPGMVAQARETADSLALQVTLTQADAGALPFDDASFDTVLSTYVLCCVPDERLAIAEAARVLRPGGRLLLADHVVSTSLPVRLGQRALEAITGPAQGERFTRRPASIVEATAGIEIVARDRYGVGGVMEVLEARRA